MADTCVKDPDTQEIEGTRRTGEGYVRAAQHLEQTVTPDGYGETITNIRVIEKKLSEQAENVTNWKDVNKGPAWVPDVPALRILEQLGDRFKIRSGNFLNAMSGGIGEKIALEVAINKLGLKRTAYDMPKSNQQGVDGFCKSGGIYVMLEAKARTEVHGKDTLKATKTRGKQASEQWLESNLSLMRKDSSVQCTPSNRQIAQEINSQGGAKSVERILVHLNPHTMNIVAYKGTDAEGKHWEPFAMWEFDESAVAAISSPIPIEI